MKREQRTISVQPGDWQRWKDKAYAARLSVSEMIRNAVEAYDERLKVARGTGTAGECYASAAVGSPRGVAFDGARGAAPWERKPFTKHDQTRRGGK